MRKPDFHMNDLATQLRSLLADSDVTALTSKELSEAISRSHRVVYRLLDEMDDEVEVVSKQIINRAGVRQTVPAYRLKRRDEDDQPAEES